MKFDKNLFKNVTCFDNLTKSASQIAGFQIIETGIKFLKRFLSYFIYIPVYGSKVSKSGNEWIKYDPKNDPKNDLKNDPKNDLKNYLNKKTIPFIQTHLY